MLQDGDCCNYIHHFDGYGIVLARNCGDVSSCVVVYIKELDKHQIYNIKHANA